MHISVRIARHIPLVNMFLKGKEVATAVEFALTETLIFLTIVVSLTLLSERVTALYDHIAAHIEGTIGGS